MDNIDGTSVSHGKTSLLENDARWIRLAIVLWIALAVAVCVKSIVQKGEHSVYVQYAWSSRHWWADQPLHARYFELVDIFRYSPTFAIVFTPFLLPDWLGARLLPDWLGARLPPDCLGASLWAILNIAVTLFALRLLVREILPGAWPPRREAWFLGLTVFGSMSGIWSGQVNSLMLAVVIFAAVAIKYKRWWTASFLLSLPVFVKIWPIAVVLLLMACWPRQLSWRFVIFFAALALLPFLTRPFNVVAGQYQEWYSSLFEQNQYRWPGNRDAWTIWENLWPPVSQLGYKVLQLASAFLVFLWCLYQHRRIASTGRLLMAIISIWVSWQLLFGPGSEQLTYGIIAPSAAWAVLVSIEEQKHRLWTILTWLTLVLCSCGEIETPLIKHLHPAFAMLLPLSVASFAVWLVWHESRWGYPEIKQ
ncbi:MAG: glycosyltransferase family 87 protein [Thermoguttaceae bacterium]